MKVLLVSPRLPWPTVAGGQVGIRQHVDHLARRHSLHLICLHAGSPETIERARREAPTSLAGFDIVPHRPTSPAVSWLMSRPSRWPATMHRYRSRALLAAVRDRVRAWKPDVALAEHLHMAFLCGSVPGVPWALMAPNLETAFLDSLAKGIRAPWRWLFAAECRRMARLEPELVSRAHAVGVVNEREGEWIRRRVPDVPIIYLPVGVADQGPAASQDDAHRAGFLSVGSLDWPPNRDAAEWLLRELWPRVRARAPEARLTLVGEGTDRLAGGDSDGARGLGLVEDVRPHLRDARALLVPLRSGAGIRVKILEALASGTPVITSEEGLGDLPAKPGEHLLVARTPAEFVDHVVALERDPARARALGLAGREWALREFSLSKLGERLERLLTSAIDRYRSGESGSAGTS